MSHSTAPPSPNSKAASANNSHEILVVLAGHSGSSDLKWLAGAPRPYRVVNKSSEGIPNTGLDASTYLWWIVQNFAQLPNWTLFMHLHEYVRLHHTARL
mmetsp:Transcript_16460/g.42228  ORF Transcript_16460/g.42228 Transcript_16460/m.42228 type:complete len:99 (+) Transcript_16460:159-455(+)